MASQVFCRSNKDHSGMVLQDAPKYGTQEEGLKPLLEESWSCLASFLNIPGMPPFISLSLLCMYTHHQYVCMLQQ